MKPGRIYIYIVLSTLFLVPVYMQAQVSRSMHFLVTRPPVFTPVFFTPVSTPSFSFAAPVFSTAYTGRHHTYLAPFSTPVHYTAFFCKMEVKSMKSLGIMIKVHAGDYDSYSKDYTNPQGR